MTQKSEPHFNIKTIFILEVSSVIGITIIKLRRLWDGLIVMMGMPRLVKWHLYIGIIIPPYFHNGYIYGESISTRHKHSIKKINIHHEANVIPNSTDEQLSPGASFISFVRLNKSALSSRAWITKYTYKNYDAYLLTHVLNSTVI